MPPPSLHQGLNDSESEDVLHAINPNEVFPSGPLGETLSESDSGISEDPVEGPVTTATVEQAHQAQATIYQVGLSLDITQSPA